MLRRPGCSISAARGVEEKHPRQPLPASWGSGGSSAARSLGRVFSSPPVRRDGASGFLSETRRRREASFADPTPKVKGIRQPARFSPPHVTQDDPEGGLGRLPETRRVLPRKASSLGVRLSFRWCMRLFFGTATLLLVVPVGHAGWGIPRAALPVPSSFGLGPQCILPTTSDRRVPLLALDDARCSVSTASTAIVFSPLC